MDTAESAPNAAIATPRCLVRGHHGTDRARPAQRPIRLDEVQRAISRCYQDRLRHEVGRHDPALRWRCRRLLSGRRALWLWWLWWRLWWLLAVVFMVVAAVAAVVAFLRLSVAEVYIPPPVHLAHRGSSPGAASSLPVVAVVAAVVVVAVAAVVVVKMVVQGVARAIAHGWPSAAAGSRVRAARTSARAARHRRRRGRVEKCSAAGV